MKLSVGVLAGLLLSFSSYAQVYDLVRTIKNNGDTTYDSAFHAFFISTGTMEIADNNVIRAFHTCEFDACKDFVLTEKLLSVDPSERSAALSNENGDIGLVIILSLSPTIILLNDDREFDTYRIDEYKPRQQGPGSDFCGAWGVEIQVFAHMYVVAQYKKSRINSIWMTDKTIDLCSYTRYKIYKMYQQVKFT